MTRECSVTPCHSVVLCTFWHLYSITETRGLHTRGRVRAKSCANGIRITVGHWIHFRNGNWSNPPGDLLWVVRTFAQLALHPGGRLRNAFTRYQPINSGPFVPRGRRAELFPPVANSERDAAALRDVCQSSETLLFSCSRRTNILPLVSSLFCFIKYSVPSSLRQSDCLSPRPLSPVRPTREFSHWIQSQLWSAGLAVSMTHWTSLPSVFFVFFSSSLAGKLLMRCYDHNVFLSLDVIILFAILITKNKPCQSSRPTDTQRISQLELESFNIWEYPHFLWSGSMCPFICVIAMGVFQCNSCDAEQAHQR